MEQQRIDGRDLAVLLLLYGCGLRISEALNLTYADAPKAGASLRITGKGGKMRLVPVLPVVAEAIQDYLAASPWPRGKTSPLFVGAKGGKSASLADKIGSLRSLLPSKKAKADQDA